MGIFIRLYTKDGLTHIEEMDLTTHPELATLQAAKGVVEGPGSIAAAKLATRGSYSVYRLTGARDRRDRTSR